MKLPSAKYGCSSIVLLLLFCGCQPDESSRIPRPRAYPRVIYPERNLVSFSQEGCPLSFKYPDYMKVVRQENFFEEKEAHPCWFDLHAPSLGATLHCSYAGILSQQTLDAMVSDAFRIADRINQRSNYMDEIKVGNAYDVGGLLMEFSGSAASPLHFYLTDSTRHFLKASLYFQSKVVQDSLAPILNFIREDIAGIINTVHFTNEQAPTGLKD